MNEPQSPLPPPVGVICPNCNAPQSTSVAYCANCGAPLPAMKSSGTLAVVTKVLVVSLLLLGALGLGATGGCMVLLGMSGSYGSPLPLTLLGLAALLVIAAFGLGIFWFIKK